MSGALRSVRGRLPPREGRWRREAPRWAQLGGCGPNHWISNRNRVRIEIGVSHRKQKKATNSHGNSSRRSGDLLCSKKMTKTLAKDDRLTLRIIADMPRFGLGTGSRRDPEKERSEPGSRWNQHRRRRLRDRHSSSQTRNLRSRRRLRIRHHSRRSRRYRRNRIRVSSSLGQAIRSQENRGQASQSRVRRNCQKLTPGQAGPGKMKMRLPRTKIPARSRSSIHRREIRGGRQTPAVRIARCAIQIVNSRMRIGSWRNSRIECDLYWKARDW
jgi:hypothetical protein